MIEYFSAHLWQLWLLVSLLCLIIELTSGDLYVLCFSIGAAITLAASLFSGASFTMQVIIFAIASVLCLLFVRPTLVKKLHKGKDERVSNADALIGREGTVSRTIEAGHHGRVAIDGDDWKAVSLSSVDIPEGTKVRVTDRDSIILTVEPVE
ncbi:MAG: NfeD family protein [Muribaculaceae bacterium]|nr:NfeD family protein [Muribaculaceae bacterium]